MNFGVRLPGPFRVGVSSHGRVHAGVTVGPFSVSTGAGGRRRPAASREPFHPTSLDEAVGELVVAGWLLRGHDGTTAHLTKGWWAVQVAAVEGGVTWRHVTSTRKVVAWLVVIAAVVALCWGLAA